ncbi:MAG: DNA translocase FtsK 4TM domain-containing protein [bacterium]
MARRKRKQTTDRKRQILGGLVFLLALLLLVSLISHSDLDDTRITGEIDSHLNPFELQYRNQGGMMGAYLSFVAGTLIGWLAFFVPIWLVLWSLRLFSSKSGARLEFNSFLLFVVALLGTLLYNIHFLSPPAIATPSGLGGGFVALQLNELSLKFLGELGSYIVLGGVILLVLMLYTSITPFLSVKMSLPGSRLLKAAYGSVAGLTRRIFSFSWLAAGVFRSDSDEDDDDESDDAEPAYQFDKAMDEALDRQPENPPGPDDPSEASDGKLSTARATRKTKLVKPSQPLKVKDVDYSYPTADLLTENPHTGAAVESDELAFTARMLQETLETFGVKIDGDIQKFPGPIITRYEFKPAAGIKVNQIIGLADDLALALKAQRIRIIAPIPGKAAVGVEIPNRQPQPVYLRDIVNSGNFMDRDLVLPMALGKTTAGRPYVTDLTRMPHLLIAGATGSGKSVCMNVLISSLLYRMHPLEVRFIMIDPKMLELSIYSGIPHMGRPVVTKPLRAEKVLAEAVVEMEKRYRKLAEASVRNIADFNKKQSSPEAKLPYIVIFVDELADLMMSTTSSKTELLITRLAQMSRAVGIHLILATQRPSVDVITGLIKANFPARIAFQVSSKVDSRTIIDQNGAEKLLGKGDMLFLPAGQPEPIRIHGAYLSSDDTDKIVNFIKDQGLEMFKLESISQATGEPTETDIDFGDPLFREACETVVRHKQGSVSLLQRRLGVGYQRAARLIDKLEQAGIVTPFDGSKARDVLVDKAYVDTLFAQPGAPPPTPVSEEN